MTATFLKAHPFLLHLSYNSSFCPLVLNPISIDIMGTFYSFITLAVSNYYLSPIIYQVLSIFRKEGV